MRICFKGRVFQFRALPFGIAVAPWLFTKVMASVKLSVDLQRLSLFQYLDDWLGECFRRTVCSQEAANLVRVCHALGLIVNLEKSELVPSQTFTFIGVTFNLKEGLLFPTTKNIAKVVEAVTSFLSATEHSAQDWESLLGILGSQDRFIQWGRFHLRPIQLHFLSQWRPSTGSPMDLVSVPESLRPHLRWWLNTERLLQGIPLEPPEADVRIFTDASTSGWGAHLDGRTVQGVWSTEEAALHINILEMRAVRLALMEFGVTSGASVLVATDNATVVAYINKQGGTRSRPLWFETVPLLQLAIDNNWLLRARHIPGRLNVIADQLSRSGQTLPTEWSLHPDVARWVFSQLGTPTVDLFATRYNRKLDVFVSPVPDPWALETDALSIQWDGLWAYAYPPPQILGPVLQKFRMTGQCRLLLIAPMWPKQGWFPELVRLANPDPLPLPLSRTLLKQPRSNVFHHSPQVLQLHAWMLEKGV